MSEEDKKATPATRLTHAGRRPEWTGRVVNTPVWRASTHLYESEARQTGVLTTRPVHSGRRP
ncbi:MAG: cystathionine beta-lyase, partial [Pseudomonadota bacterium]